MCLYDWPATAWNHWPLIAILVALTLIAENLAFDLPVIGSVSLAFAFDYAALNYAGPIAAAIVVVAGTVTLRDLREHKSAWVVAFNMLQLPLGVLLAGIVYLELGGVPLTLALDTGAPAQLSLVAASVSAVVLFTLNVLMVSVGISFARRMSLRDVWRLQNTAMYSVSFVGLALLGVLMAQLMLAAGWVGILLLLFPLAVARQTFQVYQKLTDAYSQTIKSLISAIEAKDPYTRGHSERVAGYARLIGEGISLPGPTRQTLEFAALLHDVGKIGVHNDTLMKQDALTQAEFAQIRRHPDVGRSVLEAVEFLEDVVPIVHAHHERPDGTGYPQGLSADEIPLEARILAVADCFDAMTSNRAYRRPMSLDDARAELLRVAGSQLDTQLVREFLSQVSADGDIESLVERTGAAVADPL
ncbi:MAG: metal dependent [Actinobacteria bacterium]|nr:MAG: metal dependent [Actinomycetota bacterium]